MKYIKKHFKLITFCIIVVLLLILNSKFGWSSYLRDAENLAFLSNMIRDNMLATSLIYIGLTIVACVVLALPGVIFAVLAGTLFGPWWGTLLCLIATTLGAIIAFIVGRFFLQDSIKPMLEKSPKLKKMLFDDVGRSDITLLAITRLVPIFPYNLQNFAYGITDISLSHYSLYTFLFMIPGVALYTVGAAGFTSENKALCFGIAGGLLILCLLLGWLLKRKMDKPKISIVLAVYNGEEDVEKCIMSLRNQTLENIEIICVDDGSTDRTLEILKKQALEDSRIKVFAQGENKKLLLAIKRGVKKARGEYIMFIDDDDSYELNACERVAEIIDSDYPDIVYFGTNLVEPGETARDWLRENRLRKTESINFKYEGDNTLGLKEIKYNYIWNKAVKSEIAKKAYDSIPNVEMTYHSDKYACMLFHYFAHSLVSIEDKLINYNFNSGLTASTTMLADRYSYMMRCTRIYHDGLCKFYKEKNEEELLNKFKRRYKKRIKRYIKTWLDKVPDSDAEEALEALFKYHKLKTILRALDEYDDPISESRKNLIEKAISKHNIEE